MALIIERPRRKTQAVNLTPLIDVVFLLIVFFMLSTTFVVSESLELGLPDPGKKASSPPADVMVFRVISDGAIAYEDSRLSRSAFAEKLRHVIAEDAEQNLLIQSSPGVNVQQLVTILDIVYMKGGRNVQIDHAPGASVGDDVRFAE